MFKKIFTLCFTGAFYVLSAVPAYAWTGAMCGWPFKPFRWMGPAFADAFHTFSALATFNNYGNAGFW
jgi:hypothetical protein